MKTSKQRKGKGEQPSTQRNIIKNLTGGQKSRKSAGGKCHNIALGKELSTSSGTSHEHCNCNSDKCTDPARISKFPSDIKEEVQMLHSSAKIKLQLFPLDERTRNGLEKDGHNPFLELTLRPRKKVTSVLEHLCNKWGGSSIALGELMLFPFNDVVDKLTSYKRWTSSDIGVRAGDVHAAIGNPDIFRLRYGWVSTQPISSTFSPSLGYTEPGHLERVSCSAMETTAVTKIQTEVKSKELKPCNTNEVTNVAVEQPVSNEPLLVVHTNQADVKDEEFKASETSKTDNDTTVKENPSAEPFKNEGQGMHNDSSFTSLLWSDLSNISIGGLFSEASLQGIFNNTQDTKLGGSRLGSQPTAVYDSLDAFIDQLNCRQITPPLPSAMPSSILDAEDTCHSFAFSKPSGSGKDYLSLGRRAFSELSNQGVASSSRSFKCPKSEVNALDGVTVSNAVQESKADPLPCSKGAFNNENSMGLSSIKWNDSLGPFDLPLTSRQSIKDDSTSIGGFVR